MVGLTGVKRERTGLDPGWRESVVHGRLVIRKGGAAVAGPGL